MIASLNRTLFTGHSSDAVDRLWKECVESALPMTERLRASEWCERFRVIPEGKSHTPGPISLAKTPHVIMPLDLACSGQVREAIVAWAVQTSKTEGFLLSKLLYTLLHRRVNAGYVMPTRDRMEEEADQKIIPALLAAVGGEEAIASSKLSRVSFRAGNTLYMYGGNSPTAIKGPAIPEGIGDEVDDDAMNEDSLEKLSARSASFPDDERCMTLASTYLDWGHGLHARAMNSQVYRYEVPCPHCGTYQELHFRGPNGSGVVWDKPETGDRWRSARAVELAERTAFYRCCNHACVQGPAGGRILGVHKPWMLAMGVWVARDPYNTDGDVEHVEVDDPGRVLATRSLSSAELGRRMLARRTYDQMRDASLADEQFGVSVVGGQGLPPRVAFEMGSVYSPFNGFGRLAGLWVGRGGRTDRTFSGHYLGTPHREPGDRLEPSMVAKLCTPIEEGGYPIGYAPPWALFLAMQADLQRDRAVITLRAYGARGERSGLVWVGEVPCALGADLVEIDPLRTLSVPIWQRTGEPPLPIGCVTVDSGDGQRAPEVWVWAKRWNAARDVTGLGPNARPCKGMSGKSEKPHDRSWVDPRAMNPRQMKHAGLLAKLGRFQVLRVNRDHYTAEVYRRVRGALAAGQDDGTLAAGGPAGLSAADAWVYPADWGEGEACSVTAACSAAQTMGAGRHFRELTAVEGRTVRHKQTQRERFEWVVIAGRDDHSLDAERYGLADVERRGIAQMEARPDLQAAGQRPRGSSAEPSRAARTGGTAPSERPYDA